MAEEKNEGTFFKKVGIVIATVFLVCMFISIAVIIVLQVLLPEEWSQKEQANLYASDWYRVYQDGTREKIGAISDKGSFHCAAYETVAMESTLPDVVDRGTYICLRSSMQKLSVYIDGEERAVYDNSETRLWAMQNASGFLFVPLEQDDAGKTIRYETVANKNYSGFYNESYIGTYKGIWRLLFDKYGYDIFIEMLMVFISIIFILVSCIVLIYYKERLSLFWLGVGLLITSLYLITSSTMRQFFFQNVTILAEWLFYFACLDVIPYLFFINDFQKGRMKKLYAIVSIVILIGANMLLCLILFEKISSFTACLIGAPAYCILFGVIAYGIIKDIKNKYFKDYYMVGIFFIFLIPVRVLLVIYSLTAKPFNPTFLYCLLMLALFIADFVFEFSNLVKSRVQVHDAEQASRSKSNFLANMSHEIRTPINAILGFDTMILREAKNEDILEYANNIKHSGDNLLNIINDILDFSKIEAGKMEIVPTNYRMSSLVNDIMNMILMKGHDKGLTVKLELDSSIPDVLYGDDVRIKQILINLLNNAIKYTDSGSVVLKVSGVREGENIKLHMAVTDTGRGIREEDISSLAEKYKRVEENRNKYVEGTGLGLSITYKLLEMMGSSLNVSSVYGQGSTFEFELLQKVLDEDPIGDIQERMKQDNRRIKYKRRFRCVDTKILVVDDNSLNRTVIKNLLKEICPVIDEAESGMTTLNKTKETKYDLILLDHMMPEMDGVETFKKIREDSKNLNIKTPTIMLTANAIAGAKEGYMEDGFNDFLSKPVEPGKLEYIIEHYISTDKLIYDEYDETVEYDKEQDVNAGTENVKTDNIQIDGVINEYALSRLGSEEMFAITIKDFAKSLNKECRDIAQLKEATITRMSKESLYEYEVKVHALKSNLALIGAVQLSGVARTLEFAAKDYNFELIAALTDVFLAECNNLKNNIINNLGIESTDEAAKEDFDKIRFSTLLDTIKNAILEFDVDNADKAFSDIKGMELPEDIVEKTELLESIILNIDIEQCESVCNELKNMVS